MGGSLRKMTQAFTISERPAMAEKPRFQVRMVGANVSPETVRATDLAEFVTLIEDAILAADPGAKSPDRLDEAKVSLVRIEEGSNKLTFAVMLATMPIVATLCEAIASGSFERMPRASHQKFHEISKQAASRHWDVEFVADTAQHIPTAVISAERPVSAPASLIIVEPTMIWGRLMRVGGAKPRGELRLLDGDLLYFDLTTEMAKELGDRLYEEICVEGDATFEAGSRKLVGFKATRVTAYAPGKTPILETFREIARITKGCWDEVDIIHASQEQASPGQEYKSSRAKAYLARLGEAGEKLMLPAPALAEYLVGIPAEFA